MNLCFSKWRRLGVFIYRRCDEVLSLSSVSFFFHFFNYYSSLSQCCLLLLLLWLLTGSSLRFNRQRDLPIVKTLQPAFNLPASVHWLARFQLHQASHGA